MTAQVVSEAVRAGAMSREDFLAAESCMSRSKGFCNTMGTASTMACLVEAMGITLPQNAAIPAVDSRRNTLAHLTGRRIVEMVREFDDRLAGRLIDIGVVQIAGDPVDRRHAADRGGTLQRHAVVFVSPEVDDDFEIEINPAELRIDVYRASGAGGQHVNRTESAVRITHAPSGIVVQCQNDRSQHKNRATAMKQLKAKLYELEVQRRNADQQAVEDSKSDIGWGSQIRSYVLDQSRIKDLRTGVEIGNTQAVLDGDLDPFIEASLKQGL